MKSPFENNPFIDGFVEWMDAPEGQHSIDALDLVFDALEHAGVDARRRKIMWDDGKQLSIKQSVERIHAGHPDVPRDQIESHLCGWLENCAPKSYSEHQLEELDQLVGPWIDEYQRASRTAKSSRELRTLKVGDLLAEVGYPPPMRNQRTGSSSGCTPRSSRAFSG
jgi:hypothetical protein